MITQSFKKCCLFNDLNGAEEDAFFEDGNDVDKTEIGNIHLHVPMKESCLKTLIMTLI